jgi:hypothetical protein
VRERRRARRPRTLSRAPATQGFHPPKVRRSNGLLPVVFRTHRPDRNPFSDSSGVASGVARAPEAPFRLLSPRLPAHRCHLAKVDVELAGLSFLGLLHLQA